MGFIVLFKLFGGWKFIDVHFLVLDLQFKLGESVNSSNGV